MEYFISIYCAIIFAYLTSMILNESKPTHEYIKKVIKKEFPDCSIYTSWILNNDNIILEILKEREKSRKKALEKYSFFVCKFLLMLMSSDEFINNSKKNIKTAYSKYNILYGTIFFILSIICAPLDWFVSIIIISIDEKETWWRQFVIDIWHLFGAIFFLLCLFYLGKIDKWFYLLPVLKIVEYLKVLVTLTMNNQGNPGSLRSIIHLLLHYCLIIICFACIYLFLQETHGLMIFMDKSNKPIYLTELGAFYFSLTSGSTLGYGDITPCIPGNITMPILLQPVLYTFIEVILILMLIVWFVPQWLKPK